MVAVQSTAIYFLEGLVGSFRLQSVEGELDVSYAVVVGTKHVLDGRIRSICRGLAIARTLIDAYHLEGHITQFHVFAQQPLAVFRFQFLGLVICHHQHLAFLLQVYLVDVSATKQVALQNLTVYGVDTHNLQVVQILFSIAHRSTVVVNGTHVVDGARKLLLGGSQVLGVQVDATSLAQSLIGFRGVTPIGLHRVGEPVASLLYVGIDESVACTQQHDNHKNAPRHSKSCQCRAQLVASCRLPYFTNDISHNSLVILVWLVLLVISSNLHCRRVMRCGQGFLLSVR